MVNREADFHQNGLASPIIVAVDNGGTNTRIEACIGGEPMASHTYATPTDYYSAITAVDHTIRQLTGGVPVDAIGFAVAGKVEDGVITSAGELQDYGWCQLPFQNDVAAALNIEPSKVRLLNDCVAAAKGQSVDSIKSGEATTAFVETISTGFGGAGFDGDRLIPDEPGHEFYKDGATCGCGSIGCAEAHISGSGIERKYGIRAEDLPDEVWGEVVRDAVNIHVDLLNRLHQGGLTPEVVYVFGSVGLKSRLMLPGITAGLIENRDRLSFLPLVKRATHGDDSGLVGAREAAKELVTI